MEIVCAPSAAVGTPNVRLSVTERVKHWNETITHRAPAEMPQPETTLTTGVDEAAQARLHALIRANTRLMRSPASCGCITSRLFYDGGEPKSQRSRGGGVVSAKSQQDSAQRAASPQSEQALLDVAGGEEDLCQGRLGEVRTHGLATRKLTKRA